MRSGKILYSTMMAGACAISSVSPARAGEPQDAALAAGTQAPPPEEVVVTAQKRPERLQNVPISIAVVKGADLDKSSLNSAAEALSTVAGVAVSQAYQGGGTLVTIRGVAAGGPLNGGASPVSYYVDSVPFGLIRTAVGPDAQAFDLQQVEVLRGPQGTLYGSNAQNGVVRILTHEADLNKLEFKARVSDSGTEGGGNNFQSDAAVNVPIIKDVLAARAVFGYQNDSGWIDTPTTKNANSDKIKNGRLKINAAPTENLTIGLSAWISRADYAMPSFGNSQDFNTVSAPQPVKTDFDAYGLKIGYTLPTFTVTSSSSYFRYLNDSYLNLAPLGDFLSPGVPINLETTQGAHVTSEELNLTSTAHSAWRWSVGGMFRRDSETLAQASLPTSSVNSSAAISTSYAGYGELTRLVFDDKLELTAGVRHFVDDQSNVSLSGATKGVFEKANFVATTPRFVVTVHPDKRTTYYASYSQGFRSGIVGAATLPESLRYTNPDKLNNFEVGTKGSLSNAVSYDLAAYYIIWNGVQQLITVPVNNGVTTIPTSAIINSQSASGPGADVSVTVRPLAGLNVSGQFSWNNLTFDHDVLSNNMVLFAKGTRLNFSPKYTAGGAASYSFDLGKSGWTGRLNLSANYTSPQSYRSLVGKVVGAEGEGIFITRADFSVISAQKWAVTLFVDNLNNSRATPIVTPYLPASNDWNDRIRPRTAGLRLSYGL